MNDSMTELYTALAKAHAELTNPRKDAKADLGNYSYKYASLGAILDHVRPTLAANGLAVAQNVELIDGRVEVTTLLTHSSGGWMSFGPIAGPAGSSWQQLGSSITYGRRYALTAALGIAAEDDDDAQLVSRRPEAAKPEPKLIRDPEMALVDVGSRKGPAATRWATEAANEDQKRYLGSLTRSAGYPNTKAFLESEACRKILGGKPSSPLVLGHASTLIDALFEWKKASELESEEAAREIGEEMDAITEPEMDR